MKSKILVLTLIAMTVLSCNSEKKKGTNKTISEMNTTTIENTKWIITKLDGSTIKNEKNTQEIFFLLDSKTNRITGNSGCNTFMGTYTLEANNRISFTQMASTRMMCPDSKINESEILSIFETADNFTITNGKLSLNKAKRAPLAEFKKVEPQDLIVEKYWKLKILEGEEVKMTKNQEREIYFTLKTKENKVIGFAGCNAINGEYVLEEGNRIRFKNMATTLKICPDENINEAEFLKVLELTDNFTINGDILSISVGKRAPLAVFEAVYMQ